MRKEDAYALEMQLQLKRAEREQRRLQLSVEFASTFADVSDKKRQLDRLSAAVADIEATRQRKSREFGHMQVCGPINFFKAKKNLFHESASAGAMAPPQRLGEHIWRGNKLRWGR